MLARVTTQPVTTRLRPTSYLETVSATDRTDSLTVSRHVTLASADRQLGQADRGEGHQHREIRQSHQRLQELESLQSLLSFK